MRRSCQMAQCTLIACEALCMLKKGHIFAAVVSGDIPVGYGGCLCRAVVLCGAVPLKPSMHVAIVVQ